MKIWHSEKYIKSQKMGIVLKFYIEAKERELFLDLRNFFWIIF